MKRLRILSCWLVLGAGPAIAADPQVTAIPEGVQPADPTGAGQAACDVLIRYDDGTDDMIGSGYTLGGPPGGSQRLGIVAQAPPGGPGTIWQIQSVGFYSEFWVTPGNVNIEVTALDGAPRSTTGSILVSGGGTWDTELANGFCMRPEEEFSVMLCPDNGVWGVTGEDTSSPDLRSYFSQTACAPETQLEDNDLMIWACVTLCPATSPIIEVPTLGRTGLVVLSLLLAGFGAFWVFARRSS